MELPGPMVFLAAGADYAMYTEAALSEPRLPAAAVNGIIHVAIATPGEVEAR